MANQNSSMMDLDFTGVDSYAFIPVGEHLVTVKDAQFKKASTGSDQLEINFEDANGATRKSWYSLVPQALWKVKQVLEALGISCEGKIRLNTRSLVGKRCSIIVETDANDPSRQIVTSVNKVAGSAPEMTPFVQPPQDGNIVPTPTMTPSEGVEQPPVAQTTPAPQGNMPPWMQAAQNTTNSTPQGNLPPWMRPKQ